jgi:hypothetical protein
VTTLLTEALAASAPAAMPLERAVVRVDLLPPEVGQRRRLRTVQKVLAGAVVAVLAAIGGAYTYEQHQVTAQQGLLDAAAFQGVQLQKTEAKYADAPRVIALAQSAASARSQAMATDVAWYAFLDDVSRATPQTAWLLTATATVTGTGTATTAAAPLAPADAIGTITLTGKALSYPDVATYLEGLATVKGFGEPYLTAAAADGSSSSPVITFSISGVLTADALTHRFDQGAN